MSDGIRKLGRPGLAGRPDGWDLLADRMETNESPACGAACIHTNLSMHAYMLEPPAGLGGRKTQYFGGPWPPFEKLEWGYSG